MKQALFIAGPTASGKSALSLRLAKDIGGVIINADSMQVYKGLRTLTACPSEADERAAPHKLYRFLEPAIPCSAVFWAEKAMVEIEAAWSAELMPIVIGGTGMYFKILLEGIAAIPAIDPALRSAVRDECKQFGSEKLHNELLLGDPVTAARLAPGDSQRISRAIEVLRATGKPLSEWHRKNAPGLMQEADRSGLIGKFVISPERDQLYERCNKRFDMMLNAGVENEVRDLVALDLDPALPVMRALGVPSLMAMIKGEAEAAEAIEEAKMQTRRFAKRQMTWFRNQFTDWKRLSAQLSESEYEKLFTKYAQKLID